MTDQRVATFTDANWEQEVLSSSEPVLVDFWAEWCGPCRLMAPTVEAVAGEYRGRLKVGKLNVDENTETTARYDIRGIPTVMLFHEGEVRARLVGVASEDDLSELIDKHLHKDLAHDRVERQSPPGRHHR